MIFARLVAPAFLLLVVSACGDSSTTGDECVGGVVLDGICEGKCDDSLCLEGNVCVGNRCMLECDTHTACFSPLSGDPVLQECAKLQRDTEKGLNDGDNVFVCATSPKNEDFGRFCPFITECESSPWVCPNGTPCEDGADSEGCSAAECRPLTCLTTGEGDADAYCTSFDCVADADCGPGMYCGIINLPNNICGTDKGEGDPCVDPGDFSQNAATYQEGPASLLRNTCLKREPCAPCANSIDCSLGGDMQCVTIGESNVCSQLCGQTEDCDDDSYCAQGFCVPKSGSCVPPATENFCHKCLNDLQCGSGSGTVACIEAGAGTKACFDQALPIACNTSADCPESPDGLNGYCLDEDVGVDPGSSAYHRCYLPFLSAPSSFQCGKEN